MATTNTRSSVLVEDAEYGRLRRTARMTGLAYLGLAVCGLLGNVVVRGQLYEADNAAATTDNLIAHEALARLGIALDLGSVLTQALAAFAFYALFRRVQPTVAASITAFGLVNSVAILVGTVFSATALDHALDGATAIQVQGLYDLQAAAWQVGGLFFGLWLLPMGWLAWHSGLMPRLLGWLLIAGGLGYVLGTFAAYLLPDATTLTDVLLVPATVGELWMVGYLLIKGVSTPRGS